MGYGEYLQKGKSGQKFELIYWPVESEFCFQNMLFRFGKKCGSNSVLKEPPLVIS